MLLESGQTRGTPCLSGPVTPPPASGAHIPIAHDGIVSPQRNWGEITRAQHKRCIFTKKKKIDWFACFVFFFQKNTGGCFCGKFRGGKRQVNKTVNTKFVSRASATSKNVFCVFFDDVLVCSHSFFLTLARAGNASFARARALGCAHRTPGARAPRGSLAPHTLTPPPRAHTHTTALAHYIHLSPTTCTTTPKTHQANQEGLPLRFLCG